MKAANSHFSLPNQSSIDIFYKCDEIFICLIDGNSAFKQLPKSSDVCSEFPGFVRQHLNSLLIFLGTPISRSALKMPKTIRFFPKDRILTEILGYHLKVVRMSPKCLGICPKHAFLHLATFYILPLFFLGSPPPPGEV